MCDKVVSKEPIMLKYCPERYKIQTIYDKTVDACMSPFVPNWLVMSKIYEILNDFVFIMI